MDFTDHHAGQLEKCEGLALAFTPRREYGFIRRHYIERAHRQLEGEGQFQIVKVQFDAPLHTRIGTWTDAYHDTTRAAQFREIGLELARQ